MGYKGVWYQEWKRLLKKGFSFKQIKAVYELIDRHRGFGYENISYSALNQLKLLQKEARC
jgi:SOS response regulatory protein OraA/RecX